MRAGRLAAEVMAWMVPAGNVRFEKVGRSTVDGRCGGGLTTTCPVTGEPPPIDDGRRKTGGVAARYGAGDPAAKKVRT